MYKIKGSILSDEPPLMVFLKNSSHCQNLAVINVAVGNTRARVAGVNDGAITCVDGNMSAVADYIAGLHIAGADCITNAAIP